MQERGPGCQSCDGVVCQVQLRCCSTLRRSAVNKQPPSVEARACRMLLKTKGRGTQSCRAANFLLQEDATQSANAITPHLQVIEYDGTSTISLLQLPGYVKGWLSWHAPACSFCRVISKGLWAVLHLISPPLEGQVAPRQGLRRPCGGRPSQSLLQHRLVILQGGYRGLRGAVSARCWLRHCLLALQGVSQGLHVSISRQQRVNHCLVALLGSHRGLQGATCRGPWM